MGPHGRLNVFSFDTAPAMCVRIGRYVERMVREDASLGAAPPTTRVAALACRACVPAALDIRA